MATKHTNGRLPIKLHTTVKECVTNLEKFFLPFRFTLTGPVRVKFYKYLYNEVATLQMSYHCDAFMNLYVVRLG